jgi:hypothetical protein
VLSQKRVCVHRTESYAGFCGIREDTPRFLFIANTGPFSSTADVDRLADAIDAAAMRIMKAARQQFLVRSLSC